MSRISGELRDIVREKFTPQPVDLPPDFPFSEFKVIGSGANQVIALPIQVSDAPLPKGRIQNLDENFADSSGFAFAASKEHVEDLRRRARPKSAMLSGRLSNRPLGGSRS